MKGKACCYIAGVFPCYSASVHWLVHSHMTSNNEAVSRQMPIERLSMTFTANGKRQKWNFCRPSPALCTVESKYLYLLLIVRDTFLFLCDLFTDRTTSVTEMLQDLQWDTLETMRRHARLSTIYKMCHGLLDGDWGDYLKTNRVRRTRGSHDFKFIVPKGHKDIFRFSFFPRTITEWKKLPQETVSSQSLCIFKSKLN